MKIIKSLIIGMCLITGINLKAQDVIVKTNKEEVKAKVLDVEESVIKYKKIDFQDGPTYSIKKSDVFMIIYKNGKRETFEAEAPTKPQQKNGLQKVLASNTTAAANEDLAFHKGSKFLQIGFGLGGGYYASGLKTSIPAIQARYEFSVTDKISAGVVLGYSSAKYDYPGIEYDDEMIGSSSLSYNYLLAGVRGNYHFSTSEKFDPYVGATLGYNAVSVSEDDDDEISGADGKVLFGAQVGANYYFSKKIGAWADVGYGLGYINLGIVFKF
ncbi:outer membrane beta-barrel protein [Pedobacter hiemivivus]|uniref:Porin family protein n=1 Tax=Pedobacter hiemivivus TaxID=2530454 RepID=A0A4R0NGJ6_9SPHI|nr:outer membrane beta-barrel protein [Pedobacter hiemivivus]TCC98393.1 porin family protein [Pedobacter hiemivivus]